MANHLLGWRIPRTDRFYTPEQFAGSHIPADDVDVLVKVMEKRPKPWRIVLTIAHLDHGLINHSDSNLAALCQRCHLNHDRKTVKTKREQRRRYSRRKKQLPLPFLILA
ncbi:hypothetical protein Q5H93_04505 [Hymenobacter sp. ASUV-10]|uniref:HNH endonuclease n=1 Tax=Hymenobacter aranciens TaxID=3063996 RepID=A0ABT9B865_9BACT|nr:hypothetical protein [Hymenobacter sp. ASUV-10]MDO7873985.1 hypothetical protein [Hymenobacter sp. ASUV-10]